MVYKMANILTPVKRLSSHSASRAASTRPRIAAHPARHPKTGTYFVPTIAYCDVFGLSDLKVILLSMRVALRLCLLG
jgi:hypothetical protein